MLYLSLKSHTKNISTSSKQILVFITKIYDKNQMCLPLTSVSFSEIHRIRVNRDKPVFDIVLYIE